MNITLQHEYPDHVNEIVSFFLYGAHLFKPTAQVPPVGLSLVTDFELAKWYAWTKQYEPDDRLWKNIRETESSAILGKEYTVDGTPKRPRLRYDLGDNFEPVFHIVEEQIGDYTSVSEDVVGDFIECACNRYVNGIVDNFFEKLFQCYKLGLWPCGWEGVFPEGGLVAFVPKVR